MDNLEKKNKFLPLLIWLFAFFILVFFTTNIYSKLQSNLQNSKVNEKLEKELDEKLSSLNKLQKDLQNIDSEQSKKLNRFLWDFWEDKIIYYINEYIEKINIAEWAIMLKLNSITFSEKKKSELWFKEIDINLRMEVYDRFFLKNLLSFLVDENNQYSFFITEFNFPIERSGPYEVNIPLKMYIK